MSNRRLDTSLNSVNPQVAGARHVFDNHMDTCPSCQPDMCTMAENLWRVVCVNALRAHAGPNAWFAGEQG